MKFFVDTAVVDEIRELYDYGLLDGVTTNPSLIAKSGRDFKEVIAEICTLVDGPVSAEVAATDFAGMVAEGEHLAKIAANVVIKLPLTLDGLKACRHFTNKGIKTNVTLCFSANQALLAASIRTANHVKDAAMVGADVATIPPAVIKGLARHVLTDKGLEQFTKDWAATGQTIL
ncbi:MAG: fructose-6-phosphate aldolase [Rhodobacteraceae bacterium]|nr:fructose-6-phosphate aldolase [Paracoccaceae bacterium]